MLEKDAHALVGAATIEALRSVRADVLVLGVCSLHPEVGITVIDLEESYVKRAMIANAAEVVAVSSADKLGSAAPYVVAPLDELTYLVTEESAPPDAARRVPRARASRWCSPDARDARRDHALLLRRRAAARLVGGADPGGAARRPA